MGGYGQDISRRRVLRWTGAAAVTTGLALNLPGQAQAAPPTTSTEAPTPVPVQRRPAYTVHDLLPSAPADAVALTIDDGPDPHWTPQVLDLLQRNKVRATFSLVGVHAHAHPDLVRRIAAEGHGICNHSMTHPQPFSHRSATVIGRQIADAQSAIVGAGAPAPRLFRSPGGDWSAAVLAATAGAGLLPLDWDVDPRDWSRPGTASVTRHLLAARPGDILLCHDGGGDRSQTVASLRTVLPALRSRGLTFVTL